MRILMVDDSVALTEITAELLWCLDRTAQRIQSITFAGNLQSAVRLLPQHDLVLCDGEFPIAPDSAFASEEWAALFREACRHGVDFILYSGSLTYLEDARQSGIAAIAKPATIEEVYAALTAREARRGPLHRVYVPGHERPVQPGGQA